MELVDFLFNLAEDSHGCWCSLKSTLTRVLTHRTMLTF